MANKYFHQVLIPAAATETTIYTVPAANTGIIRSLRVTNAGSAGATVTVTQYNTSGGTTHYLLRGKSVPVNTTIDVFCGVPCVLEAGNLLKVTSSVASVTFYLTYLEVDRN